MRRRWGRWCLGAALVALILSILASVGGDITGRPQAMNALADVVGFVACPLLVAGVVLMLLARVGRK